MGSLCSCSCLVWTAWCHGTCLACYARWRNINKQCGAVYPEFLQQKVLEEKLDVGFAFDGDADRLIAIDHTGCILDGDYLLVVCAQALLEEIQPSQCVVVSTVMANLV